MKKMFLAAALAASMCVPAYASQFENSGDSVLMLPFMMKILLQIKL